MVDELNDNLHCIDIKNIDAWLSKIPDGKGIYFFEMKLPQSDTDIDESIRSFGESWACWKADKNGSTPSFNKGKALQVKENMTDDGWVPLYLGKRSNLKSRIQEHVYRPTNAKTSALRLTDRSDELIHHRFRVSYLTFDLSNDEYKLMSFLEAALRNRLQPILGRQ